MGQRKRISSAAWARTVAACLATVALAGASSAQAATPQGSACTNPDALGLARTIAVDASQGPVYGSVTQAPTHDILKPGEVVLTFDDGPGEHTRTVLELLDKHCTKATFFVVGQMALARPAVLRETIARGHTVGTHTFSHPMPIKALTPQAQIEEIDKGIAAASRVAGKGLAPFFRFPGLGDSPDTLAHLKSRGIATFTVDVVTNDTFITDAAKLTERTMASLAAKGKGILLLHDLKASTVAALPMLLAELKARNFRVVHVVPKGTGRTPAHIAAAPTPAPIRPAPVRQVAQPAQALTPAAQALTPAAQALTPERLPWGLSHAGPIPTIMPDTAPRRGPPERPASARPSTGNWLDDIFASSRS